MAVEARIFSMKDYAKVTQAWWHLWHGQPINDRLLSRFGIAVCDENSYPLAICYIYPASTADLCWIGFTLRDPHISAFKAGKALSLLISSAETEIKRLGYSIVYSAFDAAALQKIVIKRGYFSGSQVQEYFKELA